MGFRVDVPALLACFLAECETRFAFLAFDFGYRSLNGLAYCQDGRVAIIRSWQPEKQPVPPSLIAVSRHEKEDHAIELMFDAQEFSLSAHGIYGRIDRVSLGDLLTAARKRPDSLTGGFGHYHREKIEKDLTEMAVGFRRNAELLTAPDAALIEAALRMRAVQYQQELFAHQATVDYAARQAGAAYQEKDYRRVIELLSPFEERLDFRTRKMLVAARQNIIP